MSTPTSFTRIIDTGTSHLNLALRDGNLKDYVPYATNAPQVMIPNGTNITACAKYNLQLPNVSEQASATDILPTFRHSLISVGQLCDDSCTATFSKTQMYHIQQKQETGHHWEPKSNKRIIRTGHDNTTDKTPP